MRTKVNWIGIYKNISRYYNWYSQLLEILSWIYFSLWIEIERGYLEKGLGYRIDDNLTLDN